MTPRSLLSFVGALAVTLFTLSPAADAQCFTPDGLDSTICCAPVTPTIPSFPAVSLPGQGICWNACNLSSQTCTKIAIGAPTSTVCGQWQATLSVFDCSGNQLFKGIMVLDYTRTWAESKVLGLTPNQVWRFAAKVDLVSPLGGPTGCPVPNCSQVPGGSAFYYGYLDYSLDCASGMIEPALVLYHGCDVFIHKPAYSSVPGAFHPNTTFALVAPDTAANPFLPVVALPPAGILMNEAMRRAAAPSALACFAEEPLNQGSFFPLVTGCLCPLSFAPPQQAGNRLGGTGMCGGSFATLNLWPLTPWYELISTSIGRWSNNSSYPGTEHASAAEGLLLYQDACDPTGLATQNFDIFYGALTQGGWAITSLTGVPPSTDRFLDLASNYSIPTSASVVFPLYGKVAATQHLIYVNM